MTELRNPLKAIIFDRDETLLGTDLVAMDQLFSRIVAAVPELPIHEMFPFWERWAGPWPAEIADEPAFWTTYWTAFTQHYGLPIEAVAKLLPFGLQYHTCYYAYRDTHPCLATLRTHFPTVRLAMLTNFEMPSIVATLKHAQINPEWFSLMVSSSTIGVAKPDPRAFQVVCSRLQVNPHDCVVVDDQPQHVTAAIDLGMRGILLDRSDVYQQWNGERIHSLKQLPQLLLAEDVQSVQ